MSPLFGLSAFPTTPADDEGRVDCPTLGKLVERLKKDDISSIGVLGSTGGYIYLPMDERKRALEAAIEAAGDKPVIAGISAMRTSDVLHLARHAEQAGAKGLLLAVVKYLPLTDHEVATLFEDVAKSTGLPICFYNNPGKTGFHPSEDLLIQLANNGFIGGVKNPAPADLNFSGQLERLRTSINQPCSLGYSGDATIAGALHADADGWYSVLAGTLPNIAIDLWTSRADTEKLDKLNNQLQPLWEVFNAHGSIRVIYEVCRLLNLGSFELPRPLLPLDTQAIGQIETALGKIDYTMDRAA